MRLAFWRKEKKQQPEDPLPVVQEQQSEMTGIEKMQAEETAEEKAEREKRECERRRAIAVRITELETQIAPQLNELQALRAELNPWPSVFAQMRAAQAQSIHGALGNMPAPVAYAPWSQPWASFLGAPGRSF